MVGVTGFEPATYTSRTGRLWGLPGVTMGRARPSLRRGKVGKKRKPFDDIQWVRLPPGKGEPPAGSEPCIGHGDMLVKRRQRIPKPRDRASKLPQRWCLRRPIGRDCIRLAVMARELELTGVQERGRGMGWIFQEPGRTGDRPASNSRWCRGLERDLACAEVSAALERTWRRGAGPGERIDKRSRFRCRKS